jgi:hypothetical protein
VIEEHSPLTWSRCFLLKIDHFGPGKHLLFLIQQHFSALMKSHDFPLLLQGFVSLDSSTRSRTRVSQCKNHFEEYTIMGENDFPPSKLHFCPGPFLSRAFKQKQNAGK